MSPSRRDFVELAAGAAGLGFAAPVAGPAMRRVGRPGDDDRMVHPAGDGVPLSPAAYAALLSDLCQRSQTTADQYLLGGEVERFEQYAAKVLGKERAVFMPSGTLANQLAIRALVKDRRRVVVPETSHVYNDTGDACQVLSGLNLVPLAPGGATFTVTEVERVLERTARAGGWRHGLARS